MEKSKEPGSRASTPVTRIEHLSKEVDCAKPRSGRSGSQTLPGAHFVPGDDPSITDEQWSEGVRKHFKGKIIVGKDLMEI